MKYKTLLLTAVLATSFALSGCEQVKKLIGGKPEGQVVATVNGEEITAIQLRQEMGNFASRDPKIMKAAQQRALEGLILRKVLVQQAKEQKLDKTADYAVQVSRGEDNLMVQTFQRKIASGIAVPSRADAESYMAANPSKFSNRRVLVVDQIVAPPSKIPVAQFQAAKTMDDVKALFAANNVSFQTNVAAIDTLTMDPRMLEQLDKLPAGEVFVIPQSGGLLFNKITDARSVPFQGEPALAYAINAVRTQRSQEAVVRQVELLRKSAESKITYNEAFKPTPAPKAGVKPATAPASAAPAVSAAPAAK